MKVIDELIEIIASMQDRIDQQQRDIDCLAELVQQLLEK